MAPVDIVNETLLQKCRRYSQSSEFKLMFYSQLLIMLIWYLQTEAEKARDLSEAKFGKFSKDCLYNNFTFIHEFRTLLKGFNDRHILD